MYKAAIKKKTKQKKKKTKENLTVNEKVNN